MIDTVFEGKKKIIFLRHGKTVSNVKKIYSGKRTDEDLCEEGIEEIQGKKDMINALSFSVSRYFSSPMKRAQRTAKLLFPEREITIIDSLEEADLGEFEGKTYEELKDNEDYRKWIASGGAFAPPGGESREEIAKRSIAGIKEAIRLSGSSEEILIVCHGGIIMAALSALTGKDPYDLYVNNLEGFAVTVQKSNEGLSVITLDRAFCGDMA